MDPWALVDRQQLVDAYETFTSGDPGVMLVTGSDEDGRPQAGDVLLTVGLERQHRVRRVPGRSDRGRSATDLLGEALVAYAAAPDAAAFGPEVLGYRHLRMAEIEQQLLNRLGNQAAGIRHVFLYDTIDVFSRLAVAEFRMLQSTFTRLGAFGVLILRKETGSITPVGLSNFHLGGLPRDDIEMSLTPETARCHASELQELTRVCNLLLSEDSVTDPIPAAFAYEYLEMAWTS